MKYRAAFAMALAALILTACAAEPAADITPAAESAAPAVTTQEPPAAAVASGKPLYILNSGGTAPEFAITDTAAYLPMKFGATLLATKIDFATAQQQVLCSVDGCSHVDAGCPAFMAADAVLHRRVSCRRGQALLVYQWWGLARQCPGRCQRTGRQ